MPSGLVAVKLGTTSLSRIALPVKALFDRFALAALLVICIALLVIGRANMGLLTMVNTRVSDALIPIMALVREPVEASRRFAETLGEVAALWDENARLRAQNETLLRWQAAAQRLMMENRDLRRALSMDVEPPQATAIGARVVADTGGPFVRTLLVDAGRRHGVSVGMAVVDERGLVGRIIEAGARSARVLLLTDFNSTIPVMVEPSRDQALLAGDNTRDPGLVFMPLNPRVRIGDRVVTSGRGGVLPPGLPVGVVSTVGGDKIAVRTWVDWDRLDYVRLVEYAAIVPPERLEELQREMYGPPLPPGFEPAGGRRPADAAPRDVPALPSNAGRPAGVSTTTGDGEGRP